MLRRSRLVLTAAASFSALAALAPAASASAVSAATAASAVPARLGLPLPLPLLQTQDKLDLTVTDPAVQKTAGVYELTCGPAGGTHPRAQEACDRLAELAEGGRDPFAPVPEGQMCTQIYGGAATARITGTWHGRSVDASFNRSNGCEIARWQGLEPVLPSTRPTARG